MDLRTIFNSCKKMIRFNKNICNFCDRIILKKSILQDRFFQDDAIAEITNIFIEPNHLLARIKNGSQIHIGELGFGFGLNFLTTAKFWYENNKGLNSHILEYLAIDEVLPTKEQMLKIVDNFPELHEAQENYLLSLASAL